EDGTMLWSKASNRWRLWTMRLAMGLLLLVLAGSSPQQRLAAAPPGAALAQPAAGKLAVVGAQGANLYDAPDGASVVSLAPGDTLTAVGRTGDNQWILVYMDDSTPGWIEASDLVVFGTEQLPVVGPESVAEDAT